ncbi:glucose-1-phosphate thymidylyltransferase [Amycolatopsis balhimycina DSM 5908]|uniref:Glucose-1-phosphate thymidylyltransferase n=1 Tax=Amycolatopsis balhimycina DSM 5908 TaxID=1081091 RepID=A0A428WPC9_AMYBA|nr:glucose-1-phosphate thymidylyltransferase RfbA [Amycolatopsis balhimycina]RSM44937.1 glucose-1-phosphate thymidylyltransferase [Amycolatopsis balhimycina DSM 5908]
MKGIVLAGGNGTRLYPITQATSKQLLPVYDKPMVYYPLSVLMLAGITEILLISTPADQPNFRRLLGSGSQWGLELTFATQPQPNGLAEAFVIGRDFVGDDRVALVLGDNIFYGPGFSVTLRRAMAQLDGCVLFGYAVKNPEHYGVGEFDAAGRLVSLMEKPVKPRSDKAITGLYLYGNDVLDIAAELTPSVRGELEITDVNREYLRQGRAQVIDLGRGFAWLDTGTHDSLLEASQFVRVLENRTGVRIACLEEIALRMGFISAGECHALGEKLAKSAYGDYVREVAVAAGGAA